MNNEETTEQTQNTERKKTDKKEKLKKAVEENASKKPKRHRRTKAEIKAAKINEEKDLLRDDNYQIFAEVFKMLSDGDAEKYGISKVDKKEFEPIAKNYAMICNYYLPGGKPIYFVIASATFQTIAMLKARKMKIDEFVSKQPNAADPTKTDIANINTGKVGERQDALNQNETTVKKI